VKVQARLLKYGGVKRKCSDTPRNRPGYYAGYDTHEPYRSIAVSVENLTRDHLTDNITGIGQSRYGVDEGHSREESLGTIESA